MSVQPISSFTDSTGVSYLRLSNGAKVKLPAAGTGTGGGGTGEPGPPGPEGPPGPTEVSLDAWNNSRISVNDGLIYGPEEVYVGATAPSDPNPIELWLDTDDLGSYLGPTGPAGIPGPTGPVGQVGEIVGFFQYRNPSELPAGGLIPADWDSPGVPPAPVQAGPGEYILYEPIAGPTAPGWGDLYGYLPDYVMWENLGHLQGPPGADGAPGPAGALGPTGPKGATGAAGSAANIPPANMAPPTIGTAAASVLGVSTDYAREDHAHGYATMPTTWREDAIPVTTLNTGPALQNGFWRTSTSATTIPGIPDTAYAAYWHGWTVSYNTGWKQQFAIPFGSAVGYPSGLVVTRVMEANYWQPWYRQWIIEQSYGTKDGFHLHQHGNDKGIRRFASGFYKDKVTGNASANDEWRVQCYNTGGTYTWNAIVAKESGAVSHPKGHTVLTDALVAKEAVPADLVATVGVVVDIIQTALTAAGVAVDVRSLIALAPASNPSDYVETEGAL